MPVAKPSSKVGTLADAVALIPDGTRLAIGGFAVYQHPMAVIRELIRARRRNLTVVGTVNGNEVDMLAGAGCLARIETSYVGLEKHGLAPNFRRAAEAGRIDVDDSHEILSFHRFRGTKEGMPFRPRYQMGGPYHPDTK